MRKVLFIIMLSTIFFSFKDTEQNPFYTEYSTPFGVPPFDIIKEEHYIPAFQEGIKQQQQEIEQISNNPADPTFGNTIVALDRTGLLLDKVNSVFFNLTGSNTNEELQRIAKEISPLLSKNNDDIILNEKLFKRVKTVFEKRDKENLSPEQNMLIEETYKSFARGGANLDEKNKEQLREINKELSLLALQFGENLLKETNNFELVIENKEELAGLSEELISSAAEAAKDRGKDGKWVFTLHNPSVMPFLTYSANRKLREKIWRAYINRGNNNNDYDNKAIVTKIAELRIKRANLLGFKTHADFVLEENMAKTPANVYKLLDQLWKPAQERAMNEAKELQAMINKEGKDFKLAAWDWRYYAEKLRKEKYDLDDEVLRPYFKLENVIQGVFYVANKLYGITLTEITDLPKYHKDVKTYEVKEADGTHLGIFYADYFSRESKRGGAWMNTFRDQYKIMGKSISPIIVNCGNFSKPTADKPSLLTLDEVQTMFHEFGHALHGMLSNTTYKQLSGTSVPRDFVELPSQIMENWVSKPDVIKIYAKHYETGEVLPQILIDKITKSSQFNQGFSTVEYLAASYLDLNWHTLSEIKNINVEEFEKASLNKIGLIPEIVVRYRTPYFNHIWASGYSAGYYSYIWAEVLDADAFQAFEEAGLFDQKTAKLFRDNILSKGGTEDPMVLYKRFRGQEPKIEPLLKRRGLM